MAAEGGRPEGAFVFALADVSGHGMRTSRLHASLLARQRRAAQGSAG